MRILENRLAPATSSAEYEKGSNFLKLCFEGSSINQNWITKFSKALSLSPLIDRTGNYHKHQMVFCDSCLAFFVSSDESMTPIIEPLSSGSETQMILKVTILFGHQRTDVGNFCYHVLQTNANKLYIFRDSKEDQIIAVWLADFVLECFSVHACSTCGQCGVDLYMKPRFHSEEQSSCFLISYIYLARIKDCFPLGKAWDHIACITLIFDQRPRYCYHLLDRSFKQTIYILPNNTIFFLKPSLYVAWYS